MSQYLLDTNICIHLMRGDAHLRQMFDTVGEGDCFISELTVAELLYGVAYCAPAHQAREQTKLTNLLRLFPDNQILAISSIIPRYAEVKANLRRIGRLQGEFDMLIGSTALTHGLTLVTRYGRHFADVAGLGVEDWVAEAAA